MKRTTRFLSLLLSLLFCLGMLAIPALADLSESGDFEDKGEAYWADDEAGDWEENSQYIPFPDVSETADYAQAVAALYNLGIMTGDGNGRFNPTATMTRAEAATVICRVLGVEDEIGPVTHQVFDDVPVSHWAAGYVAKANEMGIISGNGAGSFLPGDKITFEQMIKLLVCAVGYETEAQAAGGWPRGYLAVADEIGITDGVAFSAQAYASRSDVAMLIYNAIFLM